MRGTPLGLLSRVTRRVRWAVRDRFPDRPVVRTVQGVSMTLPWAHRLPDYARGDSPYGQNLVHLVAALADRSDEPVTVIDVGANVGDSALQVLHAVPDASVVCVEADEAYLGFLRTNVGDDPRCSIEAALLVPSDGDDAAVAPVRVGGTTTFAPAGGGTDVPRVTPDDLVRLHPSTARTRVVKSDTDGYDVVLVPALARRFAHAAPVLFFEYGPSMSRAVGNDPEAVWPALAALGYDDVAVWDNGGTVLFRTSIADLPRFTGPLDDDPEVVRRHGYWDVAVVHRDDLAGREVLADLVPARP